MDNKLLNEENVKKALYKVLTEETSKVKRDEFSRVQYKIEEFQNSLNEAIKEFRQLEDAIPVGLKTVCNGRTSKINENLNSVQTLISQLKHKIKEHKKIVYSQNNEQKK